MTQFRYRAATSSGNLRQGIITSGTLDEALRGLRGQGLAPIEAIEIKSTVLSGRTTKAIANAGGASRTAATRTLGELAMLLGAGLSLDRAMTVAIDNISNKAARGGFIAMQRSIKEGVPLSRAMAASPDLFPPSAWAMAEAGEANGRLDTALTRLAETLDRAEQLRETIVSSLIYPAALLAVATGVILVMLLVVVPQFESLIGSSAGKVSGSTMAVMSASRFLQNHGLLALGLIAIGGVIAWRALKQPAARAAFDRAILSVPLVGRIASNAETARFARVLGSLIEGGVPVPAALAIAERSIGNVYMAAAIGRVQTGLKQGSGLAGPLAATGVFPAIAISFMRTGEETARLGTMLERLADVLDREVRIAIARAIGILTPTITVAIGMIVGGVVAGLMSAILGFNDLAIGNT